MTSSTAVDCLLVRSATLAASHVKEGDLLVLTQPGNRAGYSEIPGAGAGSDPMALLSDGSPANPAVRPVLVTCTRHCNVPSRLALGRVGKGIPHYGTFEVFPPIHTLLKAAEALYQSTLQFMLGFRVGFHDPLTAKTAS